MPDELLAETSDDAVLGGRLVLRQPRKGHRFGHDAILLAAAVGAAAGHHIIDLGAGVGAAGLALAARVPVAWVTLVEIDPALAALAAENITRNGLQARATSILLDVAASAAAFEKAGLRAGSADHVMMNPPFNDPRRMRRSPDASRASAHVAEDDTLSAWCEAAARLLRPGGELTLIWRADGLAEVLNALDGRFGSVRAMPVYPAPHKEAIRLLIAGRKGGAAPLAIRPGFILADDQGRQSAAAEAVLRHAAPIGFSD
jgi:tRNA1(Val) A37 N6-methylase TrmN6